MLRFHSIVITPDTALKHAVRRVLTSVGSTAVFLDSETALQQDRPYELLIYDARIKRPGDAFRDSLSPGVRVLYLVPPGGLPDHLSLFVEERTASLLSYEGQLDEEELIATATKLLREEIFGLQKYLPWGVTLYSAEVRNYEEKQRALEILLEHAACAGCRGPLRDRICAVADELMMNALYHAPVDRSGQRLHADKTVQELARLPSQGPILLQYGCSGRCFGLAVRDGFGSLHKVQLLDYLFRVRIGAQVPIENKASGAGLGLVSVMRSASKMIFNMSPGSATEVIALFDRQLFAKSQIGTRSLHLFSAPPAIPEEAEASSPPRQALTRKPSRSLRIWGLPLLISMSLFLLSLGAYLGYSSAHRSVVWQYTPWK